MYGRGERTASSKMHHLFGRVLTARREHRLGGKAIVRPGAYYAAGRSPMLAAFRFGLVVNGFAG